MAWFEDWFNTPYYHILYGHRDVEEAQSFLSRLITHLGISKDSEVLDLACGKGRHSIYLNELGLNVLGLDLSENNIEEAQKHERESLKFIVHDMRIKLPERKFDLVLNLFTSFGYFDRKEDDLAVLQSVYDMLNDEGIFVLDYLNPALLPTGTVVQESKKLDGIEFLIEKAFEEHYISKNIRLKDGEEIKMYKEQVRRYLPEDFKSLFYKVGFNIVEAFGNYLLDPFHAPTSERMIIIATKNG